MIGLLSGILLFQVFAHLSSHALGEGVASDTANMATGIDSLATRPRYEYAVWSTSDELLRTALDRKGRVGWRVVGSRRATSSTYGTVSYELILMRETPRE